MVIRHSSNATTGMINASNEVYLNEARREKGVSPMTVERWLRLIGGSFVFVSVVLAVVHSPYWLLLTGFVGLNLAQSGLTNWCPMMAILRKLGVQDCIPAPKK